MPIVVCWGWGASSWKSWMMVKELSASPLPSSLPAVPLALSAQILLPQFPSSPSSS